MVFSYILAGIVLFCAFCVLFHLRFKLSAEIDILQLKGNLCVTFLKLKTLCIDVAVERGFFVFYSRKGVPVYIPMVKSKTARAAIEDNLSFPIFSKLRFKSLCMMTEIGVEGNAAATATALAFSRIAYDIVFSVMSHKGRNMRVCRELKPVYDKNSVKTDISSIFIVSLANIIIYTAITLIKTIKKAARRKKAEHKIIKGN